jgi:hypothetical protein
MDEPLMHKTPKGEFETLIWERHMNKQLLKRIATLQQEKGVLQSEADEARAEVDEFVKTMRKHNLGQLTLRNKKLKVLNAKKDVRIRELKRSNDDLMSGYIRLQQERGIKADLLVVDDNIEEGAG